MKLKSDIHLESMKPRGLICFSITQIVGQNDSNKVRNIMRPKNEYLLGLHEVERSAHN